MTKTVMLGQTGLIVNKIGLGTWGLGGAVNIGSSKLGWQDITDNEALQVLNQAITHGVNLIDTGPTYGFGRAEKLVGEALARVTHRVTVITRAGKQFTENGWVRDLSRDCLLRSFEQSLKRLRRESVDILLLHDPAYRQVIEHQAVDTLYQLRDQGLVQAVGFATMDPNTARALGAMGGFDVGAVVCNLLNQQALAIIDELKDFNISWLALSPLSHGLLSGRYDNVADLPDTDWRRRYFQSQSVACIDRWKQLCRVIRSNLIQTNRPLALLALRFIDRLNQFDAMIVGSRKMEQIIDIVSRLDMVQLSDSEMDWLLSLNNDNRILCPVKTIPPSKRPTMCKKCIVVETMPGVFINTAGICQECQDAVLHPYLYNHRQAAAQLLKANEHLNTLFEELPLRKGDHTCILQLSGGKDSGYLLHLLKNRYRQRVLAVGVIHPFMTPEAITNMDDVSRHIGCTLLKFTIEESVFKSAMLSALQAAPRLPLGDRIGDVVIDYFYTTITYNLAISMAIPAIFSGLDAGQCLFPVCITKDKGRHLFNRFRGVRDFFVAHRLISPGGIYDLPLDSIDAPKSELPAFIAPLTFLPYEKEQALQTLHACGIGSEQLAKIKTNPDSGYFFDCFSYKYFQCESYRRHYARELRHKGYCDFSGVFVVRMSREETLEFLWEQESMISKFKNGELARKATVDWLLRKYPRYAATMGKKNIPAVLKRLRKIYHYAEYFQVSL